MKTSPSPTIPWIKVCKNAPYFEDEDGESFTPIGQNDAVSWPDFQGLFRRKDPELVERHLAYLAAHGVNCIRMMMEYCQTDNRYLEKPVGKFQPNMVLFWDDLFDLCEKYKIRILITPFDTFWMARRWKVHPYNKLNGGPAVSKRQWLKSEEMRSAIKNRFDFFIERWGASGTIFAWDLWNEISPAHAGGSMDYLTRFVEEISAHIRQKELALYHKSHLQTVSVFAPLLAKYDMDHITFQHPALDFATTHFYEPASIDFPKNTSSAARVTANMVQNALLETNDGRPFLDSENGPISYFRKHKNGLPETFDDVYFTNMQWAHLASGAAGGGMRWPYRHPHALTNGMRRVQLNLSQFAKLIDWQSFRRFNLNGLITSSEPGVEVFGCADRHQAIVWLLNIKTASKKTTSSRRSLPLMTVGIPGLADGNYTVVFWDTKTAEMHTVMIKKGAHYLMIDLAIPEINMALAIRKFW